jgi:hypothetical protein
MALPQNPYQWSIHTPATVPAGPVIADTSPRAVQQDTDAPITASTFNEDETSREMRGDIRRAQIVHRLNVRGSPDITHVDPNLGDLFIGAPHPWSVTEGGIYESMFLKYIRADHKTLGVNEDGELSQGWSVIDFVFEQMPCPWKYYDTTRTTNIMQPEWYKPPPYGMEGDATCVACYPKELTGTMQTVPMMVPVTTITRFYPRVELTPAEIRAARALQDNVNGLNWQGEAPGVWLFEGMHLHPLHGKTDMEGVKATFEATLLFRADRRRRHQWYRPKQAAFGFIILYPHQGMDSYDDMHLKLPLKAVTETNFDEMLPINPERCNPDTYPNLADVFT